LILNCLDQLSGKYEVNEAQLLKLDIMRQFKTEKEVEDFIEKYISNSSIRKKRDRN
jgi:hypothetical protein